MLYSNLYHTTVWVNAQLKLVAGSQLFPDIIYWTTQVVTYRYQAIIWHFQLLFNSLQLVCRLFVKILTLIWGQWHGWLVGRYVGSIGIEHTTLPGGIILLTKTNVQWMTTARCTFQYESIPLCVIDGRREGKSQGRLSTRPSITDAAFSRTERN